MPQMQKNQNFSQNLLQIFNLLHTGRLLYVVGEIVLYNHVYL